MPVHLILYRDFYSVPSHFLETVQLPIQQLMHCKICKRRIHHFSDARWIYRIKYTTYANTKQTKQIYVIRGWQKTYVAHTMLRWNKYTSQWDKTAQNGTHYPKSQLPKQQIIASQFTPCINWFPNAQKTSYRQRMELFSLHCLIQFLWMHLFVSVFAFAIILAFAQLQLTYCLCRIYQSANVDHKVHFAIDIILSWWHSDHS